MNKNKILLSSTFIFLSILFSLLLSCGGHEEDHDHAGDIHKQEEHRDAEKKQHDDHNSVKEKNQNEKHVGHKEKDDHEDQQHGHSDREKDHDEPSTGKAVTKASEKKGIQLLPEAVKTIGLQKLSLRKFKISGTSNYRLPSRMLVRHELSRSCYLKQGPWFIQKKVHVIKETRGRVEVTIPGARRNDEIITAGVPLLHLAWLEAFGASGHGHGH